MIDASMLLHMISTLNTLEKLIRNEFEKVLSTPPTYCFQRKRLLFFSC